MVWTSGSRWCCGGCRTTCSTSAPISAPRSTRTRPTRRCASPTAYVERLEGWCDEFNAELAKLDSFILPGGTPGAALLHQARTISRRAEREGWALFEADGERTNREALLYLNRLSDLLFILARIANPAGDVIWTPGG